MARRTQGEETWHRLKEWNKGTAPSERLAALLLQSEGFQSVDPIHPLGGPDGLKDLVCDRGGKKWVVGVYFARKEVKYSQIKKKYTEDLKGVNTNQADGFIFFTNQELTLGEREIFRELANTVEIDLFHLERISAILNSTACYGIRLDFLDMEMTKEEQLAFIAQKDAVLIRLEQKQNEILTRISSKELGGKEKPEQTAHSQYRVTPVISASMVSGFLNMEVFHTCSSCRFGYIIDDLTANAVLKLTGQATITCPNCGNIEKY